MEAMASDKHPTVERSHNFGTDADHSKSSYIIPTYSALFKGPAKKTGEQLQVFKVY